MLKINAVIPEVICQGFLESKYEETDYNGKAISFATEWYMTQGILVF